MSRGFKKLFVKLKRNVNRVWYAPALGLFALLDFFVLLIPTDGLMVSSVLLAPKHWKRIFLCVAIGSSLGALILAALIERHGVPMLNQIYPGLMEGRVWEWADWLMEKFGLWALFLMALSPIMIQPVVALAGLSELPLDEIFLAVLVGRLLKFGVLGWICTHAPTLLTKFGSVQGELLEIGVKSEKKKRK